MEVQSPRAWESTHNPSQAPLVAVPIAVGPCLASRWLGGLGSSWPSPPTPPHATGCHVCVATSALAVAMACVGDPSPYLVPAGLLSPCCVLWVKSSRSELVGEPLVWFWEPQPELDLP